MKLPVSRVDSLEGLGLVTATYLRSIPGTAWDLGIITSGVRLQCR